MIVRSLHACTRLNQSVWREVNSSCRRNEWEKDLWSEAWDRWSGWCRERYCAAYKKKIMTAAPKDLMDEVVREALLNSACIIRFDLFYFYFIFWWSITLNLWCFSGTRGSGGVFKSSGSGKDEVVERFLEDGGDPNICDEVQSRDVFYPMLFYDQDIIVFVKESILVFLFHFKCKYSFGILFFFGIFFICMFVVFIYFHF